MLGFYYKRNGQLKRCERCEPMTNKMWVTCCVLLNSVTIPGDKKPENFLNFQIYFLPEKDVLKWA